MSAPRSPLRPRPWLCTAALALAGCTGPPTTIAIDAAAPPDAALVDAPAGAPALPDLTLSPARTLLDLAVEQRSIARDACELDPTEACVGAEGWRRLLRFSVETPNIGAGDLVLGQPGSDRPEFQYSACHDHYHYQGFAEYRLLDSQGVPVVTGRKQAYCLLDSSRYLDDPSVPTGQRYHCEAQGLQRGWSDIYSAGLPCQHLDVTDVPDGAYTLEIAVNPGMTLEEARLDNNRIQVPVDLGAPALGTPTEPCPPADAYSLRQPSRECGWRFAGTLPCAPGSRLRLGCAGVCGLGQCTGSPMLRACDSDRRDGNCSDAASLIIERIDCFGCPRALVECPSSGRMDVYTAAKAPDQPYTCELATGPLQ